MLPLSHQSDEEQELGVFGVRLVPQDVIEEIFVVQEIRRGRIILLQETGGGGGGIGGRGREEGGRAKEERHRQAGPQGLRHGVGDRQIGGQASR